MAELMAGSYNVVKGTDTVQRLAMIIWGAAGDGKTTLAATAPGNKLIIQFDDGGSSSIVGLKAKLDREKPELDTALKNDLYIVDMSKADKSTYVGKFDREDPFEITKLLTDPELNIETVIIDSLTSLGNDVLNYAVKYAGLNKSTLATPGKQAYGVRLNYLKAFILNLLKLTNRFNKNIIFISHEADKHDSDGELVAVTLALGGNLPNETALSVGEVWYFKNNAATGREIFLVPFSSYKPMKSRMFNVATDKRFKFVYDVNNPDPKYEIATLYKQWVDSNHEKIAIPK